MLAVTQCIMQVTQNASKIYATTLQDRQLPQQQAGTAEEIRTREGSDMV